MGIDLNKELDLQTIRRISNLEERVKDLFTAQRHLASNSQVTELLAAVTLELQTVKETLTSIEKRISIIEDNPEL